MPKQITPEDIKTELDRVVRRAKTAMDKATARVLDHAADLQYFEIEELFQAQAEQRLAFWITAAQNTGLFTLGEVLSQVRHDAQRAVYYQDNSSSLVSRAADQAQRTVFVRFLEWTDNMLA